MHPRVVTPTYFTTIGMTVLSGRGFSSSDIAGGLKVSVINEAAAKRWWPGQDPIGKRWAMASDGDPVWITNVGIAADERHWGLSQPVNPMVFVPESQQISTALTFVVRTPLDLTQFSSAARAAVHSVDPSLPIGTVQSLDALVSSSLRSERAQTILMTVFGVMALMLAAIGIYGVMSQLVAARVQEIGVRVALGAQPGHLLRLVVLDCAWQTIAGLVAGIAAGAYLVGLAQNLLFGISPWDPAALGVVAATLLLSALAACLIPAMRALKVDPVRALRG
jgi:putative ABC transport system permease protein